MSARRAGSGSESRRRSALGELDPAEKATVLEELVRARPELRSEAERIARERLMETDTEAVTEEVAWELRSLSRDELEGRAGRQSWGYVEPTEAAWELLEETMGSFDREVERLLKLGMLGPAVDTALGLIGGLYRCRGCEDCELLLSWAPDFPLEHAGGVMDDLTKAGIEPPAGLIADLVPDWSDSLTGRKRTRA